MDSPTFLCISLHVEKSRCAILQLLHVHLKSYHPNVSVQDCIFKSDMDGGESIRAILEMNSFPVQIVISNITALGEQQISLSTWTNIKASYTITIRDSLLESNGHAW